MRGVSYHLTTRALKLIRMTSNDLKSKATDQKKSKASLMTVRESNASLGQIAEQIRAVSLTTDTQQKKGRFFEMKDTMQAFITPSLPTTKLQSNTNGRSQICMNDEKSNSEKSENDGAEGSSNPKEESKKPVKTIRTRATWSDDFFPEFGRKGPGSRPHWDLRPTSLRIEDEDKDAGICDDCKGSGVMTCTFCMGGDFHSLDDSMRKCPACASKKQIACSTCYGTKKQIELVRFVNFFFMIPCYAFVTDD